MSAAGNKRWCQKHYLTASPMFSDYIPVSRTFRIQQSTCLYLACGSQPAGQWCLQTACMAVAVCKNVHLQQVQVLQSCTLDKIHNDALHRQYSQQLRCFRNNTNSMPQGMNSFLGGLAAIWSQNLSEVMLSHLTLSHTQLGATVQVT